MAQQRHSLLPSRRCVHEQGRACHSLTVPVAGPVCAADIHRRLSGAAQRWPMLRRVRLWETAVPASQEAPTAWERTQQEALRPVRDGLFLLRAVLLRYADGAALVLVGIRQWVPRAALDRIADVLLFGCGAGWEVPLLDTTAAVRPFISWTAIDWGLGDPEQGGMVSARPLVLPDRAGKSALLLGAIVLALARYSGEQTVEVGQLDTAGNCQEPTLIRIEELDEKQSTASYLARLDAASASATGPRLPAAGILTSEIRDGRTYLPFLAPVFPLTIHAAERPDGTVEGSCWFDEGALSPNVAELFCTSIERIAARFAAEPGEPALSRIPLTDTEETAEILRLGGAGVRPGACTRIDELFKKLVRHRPDAVALVGGDEELTYRQLDARADEVAAGLRAFGITPGARVGVCLDRDTSLVIAMLGILKAGCAYVPMDLRYPPDRLRYVVENAQLPLVIGHIESFPAVEDVRVLRLDELSTPSGPTVTIQHGNADDAAYVIYTSGSTGRPKGVVVLHRNVSALLGSVYADFALCPDDVWTLFHSSAFDFSVWEIWGCLLTGGRLVVVPYWVTRDTDEFYKLLAQRRVSVLSQTPSAFSQLMRVDQLENRDLSLRLVVFGGEPLDVGMLTPWFAQHSHTRCRVVNMFGITETTVHVTAQTITPADVVAGSRSVGRALPGWSVSVRDRDGRVLPPGPLGEIYVGGAGVTDGYLNQSELTAQRFLVDGYTGERVYRSGDRGRLRPDGRLDHFGRLDSQVKIRGHRIELDEIRSVLVSEPCVSAAVVVVNQATPGDCASSRIDAYVVLTQGSDAGRVLNNARRFLPDYMTPSTITEISSIPLTANGKVDLSRLPPPAERRGQTGSYPALVGTSASTDLAEEILRIWSHCLRVEVTRDDNFFEMGGNSLLVISVLTSMRERQLPKIAPRDFYANSTAERFIRLVEELST